MGTLELLSLLGLIFTVGQYIVLWAIYAERKFTVSENYSEKIKRTESKNRKIRGKLEEQIEEEMEIALSSIQRPTLSKLWPVRLILGVISLSMNSPDYLKQVIEYLRTKKEEEIVEEEEEEEDEVVKKMKRKVKQEFPEYNPKQSETQVGYAPVGCDEDEQNVQVIEKKGDWDDEEIALLAKAVSKYPGGTPGRWEKIAAMLERPVAEVTAKAKTLKGSYNITVNAALQGGLLKQAKKSQLITDDMISKNEELSSLDNNSEPSDNQLRRRHKNKTQKTADRTLLISETQPTKDKNDYGGKISDNTESTELITKNTLSNGKSAILSDAKIENDSKLTDDSEGWSKHLHTIFEWGLRQYPKGTDQRWEKIASHIPGKSKEDCIIRFKYLADLVKKKKEQKSQES